MQVEIVTTRVANPSSALGFGTVPSHPTDDDLQVDIATRDLKVGIYEIGLIRLHSPAEKDADPQLDFVAGRDFPRQLFEVRGANDPPKTADQLLEEVTQFERTLWKSFITPVDVRGDPTLEGEEFSVLVFVRDILIGVGMRFDHFEIVPTNSGLDTEDAVRFVNAFLQDRTRTSLSFEYDSRTRENSRRSNPVCVVHFAAVLASSMEAARDYCVDQANTLLLALSLSRDAGRKLPPHVDT